MFIRIYQNNVLQILTFMQKAKNTTIPRVFLGEHFPVISKNPQRLEIIQILLKSSRRQ